jgi:hypothetical protein
METNGHHANGHNGRNAPDTSGSETGRDESNARSSARKRAYKPPYDAADRKPATERENAFNAAMWLLEGATGMLEELRHNDFGLPEDFWVHAYAARREGLLAMRAVLDEMIARSEADQAKADDREKRQSRRGGISVD